MTNEDEDLPEGTSFTAPPSKHGDYYIFHIPNKLIKTGEINPDYYYRISVKPIKKREN